MPGSRSGPSTTRATSRTIRILSGVTSNTLGRPRSGRGWRGGLRLFRLCRLVRAGHALLELAPGRPERAGQLGELASAEEQDDDAEHDEQVGADDVGVHGGSFRPLTTTPGPLLDVGVPAAAGVSRQAVDFPGV